MKTARLTLISLITSYVFSLGFASFLSFTSYELSSPAYGVFILALGFFSVIGLVVWSIRYAYNFPSALKFVSYGLIASFLYIFLVLGRPIAH